MKYLHHPVMNEEITRFLTIDGEAIFIDCTLGLGGHSERLLRKMPGARVIGMDVDAESLQKASDRLSAWSNRVEFKHMNFLRMYEDDSISWMEVKGVLVDPGISMDQLKDGGRGFSHSLDGPLDMRKDRRGGADAAEILNSFSESELSRIFMEYGEVKKSRQLAKRIIEKRLFQSFQTTTQLREVTEEVCGWRPRRGVIHPAATVFQALRIFVNSELKGYADWIRRIPDFIAASGRIALLSYHSLEDRIAKQEFRRLHDSGRLKIHKPFPCLPTQAEIESNAASRSARLRMGEVQ